MAVKLDFEKHIAKIEKKIGYTFRDKSLLKQAFTRTSFCNEQDKSEAVRYTSNEVLEFFGDGVLSLAIITVLLSKNTERYRHGIKTALGEGDFSNIKSKLSDKKNLSERIREIGLQKYLLTGEGDKKLGICEEPSVMEDLFESIIGAVYIDSGMNMNSVISVVSVLLDVKGYIKQKEAPIQSYKNALQEWCADKSRRLPPPTYKTVSEIGPDHKKVYERACYIGDRLVATGKAKNQKLADSAAAEAALNILKSENIQKEVPTSDENAITKLREYARSKKLSNLTFKDLGEQYDGSVTVSLVLCKLAGEEYIGKGTDKKNARCAAAAGLLAKFKGEKKENKAPKKHSIRRHSAKKGVKQ